MKHEGKFHITLEKVRAWRINEAQRKPILILLDGPGFEMMHLTRMDQTLTTAARAPSQDRPTG